MGRRTVLTVALVAILTVISAVLAQANWTHKGKGELKENASLTLTGELTLSTSAGNVVCPTTMGATLTGSGAAGHVNSFTVSKPSECDLTGTLAALCGTHGLTKVEKTGSWALTADETDITLSGIEVDYTFAGCPISSFRLQGSATGSLDKASAIGKVTLSGTQTLYNSAGEESGSGELKGALSVSPAGTYGVKTGASVETIWTDGNEHLGADGKLTLAGTFSFSGSGGSVSCPATVKLLLESSTVEEEEPEGEIESFTVSKPSECHLGGGYNATCGGTTGFVSKVEQTGTATLTATEEDIKVTGLALDYEFEKCAIPSLKVEGSPTISVASPDAIKEANFSAGSLDVFNSKGETIGTASAEGSTSASPSGTFQLTVATQGWRTEGVHLGGSTEEGDEVHFTGTLSWTKSGLKTSCDATANTVLWNDPEHGAVGEATLALSPDPTANPGCTVAVFVSGSYVDIPGCETTASISSGNWPITTSGSAVVIEEFSYAYEFQGCMALGIPNGTQVGDSGTLTGTVKGDCIVFSNSGDLSSGSVVDGALCSTSGVLELMP